jgi:hypothetical protein
MACMEELTNYIEVWSGNLKGRDNSKSVRESERRSIRELGIHVMSNCQLP